MRVTRIYQPGPWKSGDEITLSETASEHLNKVLRLRTGAELEVFDGAGQAAAALVTRVARQQVAVRVGAVAALTPAPRLRLHLLQCLARAEKMDWIVQKSTELGVSSIQPIDSEFSIVKLDAERGARKLEHWRAVSIAACEQSARTWLPRLEPTAPLLSAVQRLQDTPICCWVLEPTATRSLREAVSMNFAADSNVELALLIGPEGGFSANELTQLQRLGVRTVRLGPQVLRTETASLAAIAALQVLVGDWR